MTTAFAPQSKLLCHSGLLDDWKRAPVSVEISPTNWCTAKCPWCFYVSSEYKQKHSREELEPQVAVCLLTRLHQMGVKSITWSGGGDPSLYSRINDCILWAHWDGLRQGMFTNAYKPIARPELLDWIRVTVTEKFILTKHVAAYVASGTKVGINFNVTRDNSEHLERMFDEAVEMGVRYFQFRPALADRWDLQEYIPFPNWIEQRQEHTDVEIETTSYKWRDYLKPHGYPKCHGHRFVPFIWHNGDVSVCAYHFGKPEFTFGNLHEQSFPEIWHGERRRKMLEDGIGVIPACQHCCKLHEINKPLAMIAGDVPQPEDLAFL